MVVHNNDEGGFKVWHSYEHDVCSHNEIGSYADFQAQHDIIAEWTEPKTGEFWVNVYEGDGRSGSVCRHKTKKQADESATQRRIACKKVTWTEGDDE